MHKKITIIFNLISFLLLFCLSLQFIYTEEKIQLKNGRYIEGTIVNEEDGIITLKTKFGTITLEKDDITSREEIIPEQKLLQNTRNRVLLKNGNYIEGRILKERKDDILLQSQSGTITLKKSDIESIENIKIEEGIKPVIPEKRDPFVKPPNDTEKPPKNGKPPDDEPKKPDDQKSDIKPELKQKLDNLFAKLKETSDQEKLQIMQKIVDVGSEAVPYLVDKMDTADETTLIDVSNALILINNPTAINPIIKKLSSENAEVRAMAVSILANIGGERAVSPIRKLIHDKDPLVRGYAVDALSKLDDTDSLEDIATLISDSNDFFRKKVTFAVTTLVKKVDSTDKVTKILCDLLDGAKPAVQIDIIDALMQIKNAEAIPHLIKLVDSDSEGTRAYAIIALGEMKAKDSVDTIIERIPKETSEWVKIQLAGALQKMRDSKAIEPLIEMLNDASLKVKDAASRALQDITKEHFGTDYDKWSDWWKKKSGGE